MATEKQLEETYRNVQRKIQILSKALRDMEGICGIKASNYEEDSPYKSLWELRERVDNLYEKPIAQAVMKRIKYLEAK